LNISFLKEKGNKYLIFILVGILILVVFLPTGTSNKQENWQTETVENDELEERLKKVLSAMEGVGKVEVMITRENSKTSIFGQEESTMVCGVVVVAEGADNASVNARITKAVEALFSVDAHKISIVKMSSKEEER